MEQTFIFISFVAEMENLLLVSEQGLILSTFPSFHLICSAI